MNRPSTPQTTTYQDISGLRGQLIDLTTTLHAAARQLDE
jgi:hypothetical protein